MGPAGVLGILGEWLFIFRNMGSIGNYLRGAGEQAHSFGDLGSLAKKQKIIKEKPPFSLIFFRIILLPPRPPSKLFLYLFSYKHAHLH